MGKQTNIQASRWTKVLVTCVFAAVLALGLTGCKYTDVLTEHIEDPACDTVDDTQTPEYRETPGAEQIPNLVTAVLSDADDKDTQVQALPHYDKNAPDNGATPSQIHSESTPHQEEATEGEEESGEATDNGEGDDSGSNEGSAESDQTAADALNKTSGEGGIGEEEIVIDDKGENKPTSSGTIAATGEYATITEMLGGAGGLVAADEGWINYCKTKGVFVKEDGTSELANVQVGWSTDSTSGTVTCNVDYLINTAKPSVVLYDGTNLTEDDKTKLEAAGITVSPVPTLNSAGTPDVNICQAVIQVAGVLSGASGLEYSANDMANLYLSYRNQVMKYAEDAVGGYAYKYIDGSDYHLYQDDISYLINASYSGFTPVASASNASVVFADGLISVGSSLTVNQRTTVSNVQITLEHDGETLDSSDGLAVSVSTSSSAYMILDYYLQFAGIVNNSYDGDKPTVGGVYPLMAGSAPSITSGNFNHRGMSADFALWYPVADESIATNWVSLGSNLFPAILCKNSDIASAIRTSRDKSDGLYNMGSQNDYAVYTVPSGVSGSWAYGNVESFLVSAWALCVHDHSVLDTVGSICVKPFYETFYRCSNWESVVSDFQGY